ncbi:hypothetical protein B0J13DRAFT_524537 [Dactylonectria estremocensis]|uniref:Uncharacterized protein n=1 Tax=Dactylonectria estremocensis TaxID=1079267 RepID=A0A9P9EXH5_9HYPO|nr:hypothetical protein B0J13DRAFT_524537 [Dactylonectria estremocensis]
MTGRRRIMTNRGKRSLEKGEVGFPREPKPSQRSAIAARDSVPRAARVYNTPNRNSLMSVQSAEFAVASLVPKPVASESSVTCSILLAEHNIFLSGFDCNGNGHRVAPVRNG